MSFWKSVNLTYHWDPLNRLTKVDDQVDDSTIKTTTCDYDSVGNLQDYTYPTSTPVTTAYNYNSLNRLTDMGVSRGGSSVATFDYDPSDRHLGSAGNRLAAREYIYAPGGTIHREVNYYYDNCYRLTKEDISGLTAPTGLVDYTAQGSYPGYDKVGNRRSRIVASGLSSAVTGFNTTTSTYDVNDRLGSSTYDDNSRALSEIVSLLTSGSPSAFAEAMADRSVMDATAQLCALKHSRIADTCQSRRLRCRAYDRSRAGVAYVTKCLQASGANVYEVGKFNLADSVTLSRSVFRLIRRLDLMGTDAVARTCVARRGFDAGANWQRRL